MNSKYYTPEIEEFSVDLECQVKYREGWKDREIRHGEDLCEIVSRYTTNKESVRIKYLDESDILDCGAKKLLSSSRCFFINEEELMFNIIKEDITYFILFFEQTIQIKKCSDSNSPEIIFFGEIKNKTELIKLFKQLGI